MVYCGLVVLLRVSMTGLSVKVKARAGLRPGLLLLLLFLVLINWANVDLEVEVGHRLLSD